MLTVLFYIYFGNIGNTLVLQTHFALTFTKSLYKSLKFKSKYKGIEINQIKKKLKERYGLSKTSGAIQFIVPNLNMHIKNKIKSMENEQLKK